MWNQYTFVKFFAGIILIASVLIFTEGCKDADSGPECLVGIPCDDNDNTTSSDIYNDFCECLGTPSPCIGIGDADGDGICTNLDCDDGDSTIVTIDGDRDGVCSNEDCDDENAAIYPGASCDDGNPNTLNDIVNENCMCKGRPQYGHMLDIRDGRQYLTIEVGTKTWMAENLNYDNGQWYCYDEDPGLCTVYGKLYRWEASLEVCPAGWHLPSVTEWQQLINSFGGEDVAGGALKDTIGWNPPNTGATNVSGFTGLPGGCRRFAGGYTNIGENAFWWSTGEANPSNAYTRRLFADSDDIDMPPNHKTDWMSVRCVKD